MPDKLLSSGASGQIRLYVEWTQTSPNRCVLTHVRCENDHPTGAATYTLIYRGNQVDTRTFPPATVTREALPDGATLPLSGGEPVMDDVGITYSGPME